jgi:hypothetical protein
MLSGYQKRKGEKKKMKKLKMARHDDGTKPAKLTTSPLTK